MFSLLLIKTEILKEASLSSLEEIQAPPCLSQVLSLLDFDSQALCGKKWFLFVWRFGLDLHFLSCDFWRMGDHFVLLVDRLLTESTLEAAIGGRKPPQMGHASASVKEPEPELSLQKRNFRDGMPLPRKLVECRICQDEDEDSNMETPCSCCGSLKYAHRKCVQRWCNEKGDTTCEICHQQFKPGYTAPPQLFQYGGIPMNFRGNWEITRQDLHNSRFLTMVATDRDFDYDDYSSSSTRSMMCCRSVAVIFMVLLVLRHTLPIIISGVEEYSLALFLLLLLRTVGILLPVYVMARALLAIQRRRQHQASHEFSLAASEENGQLQSQRLLQPQQHFIHVQ